MLNSRPSFHSPTLAYAMFLAITHTYTHFKAFPVSVAFDCLHVLDVHCMCTVTCTVTVSKMLANFCISHCHDFKPGLSLLHFASPFKIKAMGSVWFGGATVNAWGTVKVPPLVHCGRDKVYQTTWLIK